jgi:hypothetical protein
MIIYRMYAYTLHSQVARMFCVLPLCQALCYSFPCIILDSPYHKSKSRVITIILILQRRKLRLREIKYLVYEHKASKQLSGWPTSRALLTTALQYPWHPRFSGSTYLTEKAPLGSCQEINTTYQHSNGRCFFF